MAVILYSEPERYGLAYNDNAYVFSSTEYTPTNGQRFLISIIDDSTSPSTVISQERVYPRQGTTQSTIRAYYDPSKILQSFCNEDVDISGFSNIQFVADISFEYVIVIREEYKVNGVYQLGTSFTTRKTVWNGGIKKRDWLDFDYTGYDFDTGSSNQFLTQAPTTQYINDDQSAFLYLLDTSKDFVVRIQSFDASGSVINTTQKTFTSSREFNYLSVGTYDIVNSSASGWTVAPATLLVGASYYIVSVNGGANQVIRYNINQRCSKYTPIRLHWLNRLGGIDSFNFSLKSQKNTDIDRRSYLQEHHDLSSNNWFYTTKSRGQTDYHVGTTEKLTINTPFLTEEESIWMEDFASSPVVYQELDNKLIALSGKVKKIDEKTSLNDKLMQYTFEVEYSLNDMRQRG